MASIFSNSLNSGLSGGLFGGTIFSNSGNTGTSGVFGSSLFGNASVGTGTSLFSSGFNGSTFGSGYAFNSFGNLFSNSTSTGIGVGVTTTPVDNSVTIATKNVVEEGSLAFATADFTNASGQTASSFQIADLPDNGVLALNGVAVSLNQIITVGDFDNLTYVPENNFDATDAFSVKLSTDGVTYDDFSSNVVIPVIGANDDPTVATVSTVGLGEGESTTTLGQSIIDSFADVDTGDALAAVTINSISVPSLGSLQYTSDNGGSIITLGASGPVTITATEAATLVFAADTGTVAEGSNTSTEISFQLTDSAGGVSPAGSVTVQVSDGNDTPYFSDATAVFDPNPIVNENSTSVGAGSNPATDNETPYTLTYSISGTDSALFDVDPANGELSFKVAPDHEDPQDSNKDNKYALNLTVADDGGTSSTATSAMLIEVQNVPQDLSFASRLATVDENSTLAFTPVSASADISNDIAYSIVDGQNGDLFSIDASNGTLTFLAAPDFENPMGTDSDPNEYLVDIMVTDSSEASSTIVERVRIVVEDTDDEAPHATSATGVTSTSSDVTAVITVGDLSLSFEESFTPDEDTQLMTLKFANGEDSSDLSASRDLSFALTSDAGTANFSLESNSAGSATLGLNEGAEFDFETDPSIDLTLTVTDLDDGTTATTAIEIVIEPVNEQPEYLVEPEPMSGEEGDEINFGQVIIANIVDPEGADLFVKVRDLEWVNEHGVYDSTYDMLDDYLSYQVSGVTLPYHEGTELTLAEAATLTLTVHFGNVDEDWPDLNDADHHLFNISYSFDDNYDDDTLPDGADHSDHELFVAIEDL